MKLSWRVELFQLLVIAAMFAVAGAVWTHVPDRLPVHWNLQGQVDRWGGRFEGLLLMPLVALGLYAMFLLIPLIDPGRGNYKNFRTAVIAIRISLILFLAALYAMMVLAALGFRVNMGAVVLVSIGALFLVLGNFLSKIRPNWFFGIRTPWTLSSKLSWDKTHRLGGWLFMLMGLLFFVLAFVQDFWMFIAVMSIDALCLAWMTIYSYLVFRRDPHRTSPAATSPSAE